MAPLGKPRTAAADRVALFAKFDGDFAC